MRYLLSIFLLLISLVDAFATDRVVLQLKWLHQFQFAGYYAAKEKGFYLDEGLDVDIRERNIQRNNIQQVIDGEAQYGVADSMLLSYQAQQYPVVILAAIFQHSPNVLFTLKKSQIDSPYKLAGKRLTLYPKDTDGYAIFALLKEMGIIDKINRVPYTRELNSLIEGRTDAFPGYLSNELFFLKKMKVPTNVINPMNYGIDLYGDILFTNKTEVDNNPDRVQRFIRASIKGWQYALEHKAELIGIIQNKYGSKKSTEHLLYEANVVEEMIQPKSIPIGTLEMGRLKFINQLLQKHGLTSGQLSLEDYIYDPKNVQTLYLSTQEQQWLKKHKKIRLGVDIDWLPFEHVDKQGKYKGMAAEYIRLLENKLGIKFEIINQPWSKVIQMMENRQIDMLSCVLETDERKNYADFSQPYLSFRMVIVTLDNVTYINNIDELRNKKIAVVKNYATHDLLKQNHPEIKLLLVDNNTQALAAVSKGQAYAYIGNVAAVGHNIKEQGFSNIKISGETPYHYELSMATRNDWPIFKSIIQKTLNSISETERDRIYNQWIKIEYEHKVDYSKLINVFLIILVVILIIMKRNYDLRLVNEKVLVANSQLQNMKKELEQKNIELEQLYVTDKLTGINNRHKLDLALDSEIERAQRYGTPLSVILLDLDNFKYVNDHYGHPFGDVVLKQVAKVLHIRLRKTDTLGRWGGEEFMIICPGLDIRQGKVIALNLKERIEQEHFENKHVQTGSFGVAQFHPGETVEKLVSRADAALYQAKRNGKNRVEG